MPWHLVFDADDTLWENNIYFERAFEEFAGFLHHSTLTIEELRERRDQIELVNNRIHGYGTANFARNLQECYRSLVEREVREADLDRVRRIAERILDHPIELIDGVEETLAALARRYPLTLFTKGHPGEQGAKIGRSGLAGFFTNTFIVKEKDAAAYRALARQLGAAPRDAWMIGNSPKSDINPALDAGWNAVFIPHANTWTLEHERIPHGHARLLELEKFSGLAARFSTSPPGI